MIRSLISRRNFTRFPIGRRAISTEDKELLTGYDRLFPKITALLSLFRDAKEKKFLESLFENGVIPKDSYIPALILYTDLKNPVLTKYGFDVADFVIGAKEAYKQVVRAISSKDFSNYCNKYSTKSADDDLLREVLHPRIYKAARKACEDINEKNQRFNLIESTIRSITVVGVKLQFVEPPLLKPFKFGFGFDAETPTLSVEIVPNAVDSVGTKNPKEESTAVLSAPPEVEYPIGSVLAHVTVQYDSKEQYEIQFDTTADTTKIKQTTSKSTLWQFTGCVSGHIDLNWQITSI